MQFNELEKPSCSLSLTGNLQSKLGIKFFSFTFVKSGYKKFHSTETALIKVHSDIVTAIDDGQSVILVLLDLSAAFDTVDHRILLTRLSTRYGIHDRALEWFVSYLSGRTQFVKLDGSSSQSIHLPQGVPQGSYTRLL